MDKFRSFVGDPIPTPSTLLEEFFTILEGVYHLLSDSWVVVYSSNVRDGKSAHGNFVGLAKGFDEN